jgi:glycosyltransferase involved in cell wall biosynthesis
MPEPNEKIEFTVLVSCYYEEKSIDEFHRRLISTVRNTGRQFELIYVNDGSTDGTLEKLKSIYDTTPEVTAVIDLFKNVGQANAKTPGIMHASGDALILIDSDLQLDPEELPLLISKYDEGYDIVSGIRSNRKDSLLRKMPSRIANYLMRKASNRQITDFGCTYKIYDMKLVRAFNFDNYRPWRMLPVIAQAQRIAEVPITHHPRKYGKSGWTFAKLFAYNMETIVNLSERPFQYLALLCLFFSAVIFLRVLVAFIYPGSILKSVSTGLILNVQVIGFLMTLATLVMIGEFVIRLFFSSQTKPAFIIRNIWRRATTYSQSD